jgi:hypothetical protein
VSQSYSEADRSGKAETPEHVARTSTFALLNS